MALMNCRDCSAGNVTVVVAIPSTAAPAAATSGDAPAVSPSSSKPLAFPYEVCVVLVSQSAMSRAGTICSRNHLMSEQA